MRKLTTKGKPTINRNHHRIDTTLGELIATISDVAFEYSDDTKEALSMISPRLVLVEIFKGGPQIRPFGRAIRRMRRDFHPRPSIEPKEAAGNDSLFLHYKFWHTACSYRVN